MWVTEDDQLDGCYYCGGGPCSGACGGLDEEPATEEQPAPATEDQGTLLT